jgi:3-mercaptopyruvate sulfurtransferase SseA
MLLCSFARRLPQQLRFQATRSASQVPANHVITYDELKDSLEATPPSVTLIDVRNPQEFAEGSIPTARNIPRKYFAYL